MAGEFGFDLDLGGLGIPDSPLSGLGGAGFSPGGMGGFSPGDLSAPGDVGTTMPPSWMGMGGAGPGGPGGPSGGGGGDFLSSIFGKNASPVGALAQSLGLGASGVGVANLIGSMNQAGRQQRTQQVGQQMATSAAQPAINYGTQMVTDAQAGKLGAPMEAAIEQWKQQAKADMRQKLAHLGLGDSTSIQQYEQQIEQMGLSMRANLLMQEGSQGIAALGTGGNMGLGLASSGGQTDQLLNQLIAQANQSLGLLGARGGALAA